MPMKRSARFLVLSILLHALVIAAAAFLLRASHGPAREDRLDIAVIQYERAEEPPSPDMPEHETAAPESAKIPRPARVVEKAPGEPEFALPEPAEALPPPHETDKADMAAAGPKMFSLSHKVLSSAAEPTGIEKPVLSGPDKALAETFGAVKAKTKVSTVPYDARLYTFKNDLEDFWDPEFSEIHEDTIKKAVVKWARSYKKAAKHYGKTGQPSGSSSGDGTDEKTGGPDDAGPNLLDTYNDIAGSDAWTTSAAVVVDLELDGKGGWRVSIAKPSGHGSYDDEAVEDLEKALGSKSLSLPEGPIKLRLALEADFSITPPLPMAGFGFDLALKHFDFSYPLKKKISKRIRLLDVSTPGPEPG
jgi:hypothetical protein